MTKGCKSQNLLGKIQERARQAILLAMSAGALGCGDNIATPSNHVSDLNIIGGTKVAFSEDIARHTVMLSKKTSLFADPRSICSGTLILDGTYVLTAAHCIDETTPYIYVSFNGEATIDKEKQEASYQRQHFLAAHLSKTSHWIQKFSEKKLQQFEQAGLKGDQEWRLSKILQKQLEKRAVDDIAVLKILELTPEELPEGYEPVKLVSKNFRHSRSTKIELAGYGKTLKSTYKSQRNDFLDDLYESTKKDILERKQRLYKISLQNLFSSLYRVDQRSNELTRQKLDLLIESSVPYEKTGQLHKMEARWLSNERFGDEFNNQVRYTSTDPTKWKAVCYGDSGGPAFIKENSILKVAGVASTSNFMDSTHYTDVSKFVDWVHKEAPKELKIRAKKLKVEMNDGWFALEPYIESIATYKM